ncbi:MAG: ABC transporter ATP-binding protein [Trueperaceae bacterium]|jgi:putative ABC transport system ATP-binding protein|nr:ABC transporter ATP-binding protein [Trueperaceae bacterium]|tara:strand:- start:33864 stop:34646 length:783 start_codon:yes stop_codon:yes gene_type:complete
MHKQVSRKSQPTAQKKCQSPAITGENLVKHYLLGGEVVKALEGVSLTINSGEFVAVMGPSGSGKSTLLHLLGLLEIPDTGEVLIENQRTSLLNDDDLTMMRRNRLGFVFQNFELIPNLSARENILLPAEISGNQHEAADRLKQLSINLAIHDRLQHKPRELSGGQRQRVALARALINSPAVILADEPTGNLDSQTGTDVLQILREGVNLHDWTVLIVTHDPKAALFADRIVFLRDGNLSGEVNTLDSNVREVIETFIGKS